MAEIADRPRDCDDDVTIDVQTVEERVRADIEAAKASLIAILPRVDAINSFVRSEACRRHWYITALHHVVYHYKREALIQATQHGIAEHRQARVTVKCRDCGGSGRYQDWNGHTHDHCWQCNSSGTADLRFVETRLPGGIEWLSPVDKAWRFIRSDWRELPETDKSWQVNQVGKDLTPSEVAAHLCAIEAFFPERPAKIYGEHGDFDPGATYKLWIGKTEPGKCYLCGASIERIYGGHCIVSGRVTWNGIVCKVCENLSTVSVFERLEPMVPREFITPEVAAWVASHPPSVASLNESSRLSRVVAVEHAGGDDSDIPF